MLRVQFEWLGTGVLCFVSSRGQRSLTNRVLPADVQSPTGWRTEFYQLTYRVLPADVQNPTSWCTESYQLTYGVLPADVQSPTSWRTDAWQSWQSHTSKFHLVKVSRNAKFHVELGFKFHVLLGFTFQVVQSFKVPRRDKFLNFKWC